MGRIYKNSQGIPIDMEALRLANEKAIALGNMKVNAKGDLLGKGGEIIKSSKERIAPSHQAKKEVAKTSLKPNINKTNPPEVKTTKEVMEEPAPTVSVKTRKDGSTYNEIMFADGTIETEELTPPTETETKAKTRKKKGSI